MVEVNVFRKVSIISLCQVRKNSWEVIQLRKSPLLSNISPRDSTPALQSANWPYYLHWILALFLCTKWGTHIGIEFLASQFSGWAGLTNLCKKIQALQKALHKVDSSMGLVLLGSISHEKSF